MEVSAGERNYHIFYQLLTDDAIRQKWSLPTPDKLSYLSCEGQVATIEEMNDTKEFISVVHALGVFNFSENEINESWRMLAAILLLGTSISRRRRRPRGVVMRRLPREGGGFDCSSGGGTWDNRHYASPCYARTLKS